MGLIQKVVDGLMAHQRDGFKSGYDAVQSLTPEQARRYYGVVWLAGRCWPLLRA